MSISLCMIVKDEEDNLPRCLDSVKNVADEMIIVDTGSNDSTIEIAEKYGAKVYHYPWNGSFSDARNYSLKQAAYDWILIMDADDEMNEESRKAVLSLIEASDADAYFFETISYVGDVPNIDVLRNMNLRLLRNGKGYFYSNSIHEQIYCNILTVNPSAKIINKDIKIYHHGYLNKNITKHNKRARNISLLEIELNNNPGNPFTLFNLGSEYYAIGDNFKAIEYFEESYKNFNEKEGFSSHLILKMVNCYMFLGKLDEAYNLSIKGLSYFPTFTDLEFMKGSIQKVLGKFIKAINHFNKCLEMGEAPNHYNVIIGAGTYKPLFMLGEIYFYHEEYELAIENYKNCLKLNPKYNIVLSNLIKALCRSTPGQENLKKSIEELRIYHTDVFDSLVFLILMQEKFYDLAIFYIKKYEKNNNISDYTKYNRGLCKLYLKEYSQAYKILGQINNLSEYKNKAICLQALCKNIKSKFSEADLLLNKNIDRENIGIKVYSSLTKYLEAEQTTILSDDESESLAYTEVIFEILKVLAITQQFEIFEKSLGLLNFVNDKTVLLKLAKLYYSEGCYGLAMQEFMRSIKLFDLIDFEGADMLYKIKLKGF